MVRKKIESIQSYSSHTSNTRKREMSESLARAMVPTSPKQVKSDGQNTTNDNIGNLSFGELLQLTPEQEQKILNELLNTEIEQPKTNFSVCSNPLNAQNILPKMLFNNSTITINFNINNKKPKDLKQIANLT